MKRFVLMLFIIFGEQVNDCIGTNCLIHLCSNCSNDFRLDDDDDFRHPHYAGKGENTKECNHLSPLCPVYIFTKSCCPLVYGNINVPKPGMF